MEVGEAGGLIRAMGGAAEAEEGELEGLEEVRGDTEAEEDTVVIVVGEKVDTAGGDEEGEGWEGEEMDHHHNHHHHSRPRRECQHRQRWNRH